MNNRTYNKLYVNKNSTEGSEKIVLGYQSNKKEIVLEKDKETFFHIPYYTSSISVHNSGLVASGAIGASYPAASDRIYKSNKNYGSTTSDGTSNNPDGTWVCTWLYKTENGQLIWMDRFYNPGYSNVSGGALTSYINHNPIFRDDVSTLAFEPGAKYKYYHTGEKTAKIVLDELTNSDADSHNTLLKYDNWNADVNSVDSSSNSIAPKIYTEGVLTDLFGSTSATSRPVKQVINLDQPKGKIEVSATFNESYNPTEEFSVSFWCKNKDWKNATTTQLVGNYSSNGGYGLFIKSLDSYPFFVIPETKYGHVLYVNEGLTGYLDKSVQAIPRVPAAAAFTLIDENHDVIVCMQDNSGLIYKLDNIGQVVSNSKETEIPFYFSRPDEIPFEIKMGPNNTLLVRTYRCIYTFDSGLNQIEYVVTATNQTDIMAYMYDVDNDTYDLHIEQQALDCKFIETTKWFIKDDGNMYKLTLGGEEELFYSFKDRATVFAIDPTERIWVLHGTNKITILNANAASFAQPVLATSVGKNVDHLQKNINFMCIYDKSTTQKKWRAIVYYANEENIYTLDMSGLSSRVIKSYSLFDYNLVESLEQNPDEFMLNGKGDFTGYEHRRVFKNLSPYRNKNQLVLKTCLRDKSIPEITFRYFTAAAPLEELNSDAWHHFLLTYKKPTFELFVDGKHTLSFTYSRQYDISYYLRPDFYIGTSGGSKSGFNREIQYEHELFRGEFADIGIYDFKLNPAAIDTILQEFTIASDITWSFPVPTLQYTETIERMFKHKMPGSKSALYKVRIKGFKNANIQTKKIIEDHIRAVVRDTQPGYADLLKVEWY